MKVKNEGLRRLIKTTSTELHMSPDDLLLAALKFYISEQQKKKFIEELWTSSIMLLGLPSGLFTNLLRHDVREMKDLINIELIKIPGIGPASVALIEERMTEFFKDALFRS